MARRQGEVAAVAANAGTAVTPLSGSPPIGKKIAQAQVPECVGETVQACHHCSKRYGLRGSAMYEFAPNLFGIAVSSEAIVVLLLMLCVAVMWVSRKPPLP